MRIGFARSLSFAWTTSCALAACAGAIPAPVDHDHTGATVHWKADSSPALPWTNAVANQWNHNHLTADPFDNGNKWKIQRAWDNQTLRNSTDGGPANFGHGLIEATSPVRYWSDSTVPVAAADAIEWGFGAWKTAVTAQFNAKKDATDILAMNFNRTNTDANKQITCLFNNDVSGAYAYWDNTFKQLVFKTSPTFTLSTDADTKRIRAVGATTNTSSIVVDAPWSYDGTPERLTDIDLEYSDDSGATWTTTAPTGFGNLLTIAANENSTTLATDKYTPLEMDFRTIALHEIGHAVALGHAGSGIMRSDIANFANFGRTTEIDNDSALAVAIDYTYSVVPEPASAISVLAISLVQLKRPRRGSTMRA